MLDIFSDALLKSHTREGILDSVQESKQDFLEKGKKAQIGEIREWRGVKFQKQPNGGWIPVRQGTKEAKKEEEVDWKKVTKEDLDNLPTGTKISFEDELSGETIVSEKQEDGSWKDGEGNKWSSEEVKESVSHPDAHGHKMEKPAEKKEESKKELTSDQKKFLDDFFDPSTLVDSARGAMGDAMTMEDFSQWVTVDDNSDYAVKEISEKLGIEEDEAEKIYEDRKRKAIEEIKNNPDKYELQETSFDEEWGIDFNNVRDVIGDEYTDKQINSVLNDLRESDVDEFELEVPKRKRVSPDSASNWIWDKVDELVTEVGDGRGDKETRDILYGLINAKTFYENKSKK